MFFLLSYLQHCALTANPKEITVLLIILRVHAKMQTTVHKCLSPAGDATKMNRIESICFQSNSPALV